MAIHILTFTIGFLAITIYSVQLADWLKDGKMATKRKLSNSFPLVPFKCSKSKWITWKILLNTYKSNVKFICYINQSVSLSIFGSTSPNLRLNSLSLLNLNQPSFSDHQSICLAVVLNQVYLDGVSFLGIVCSVDIRQKHKIKFCVYKTYIYPTFIVIQ